MIHLDSYHIPERITHPELYMKINLTFLTHNSPSLNSPTTYLHIMWVTQRWIHLESYLIWNDNSTHDVQETPKSGSHNLAYFCLRHSYTIYNIYCCLFTTLITFQSINYPILAAIFNVQKLSHFSILHNWTIILIFLPFYKSHIFSFEAFEYFIC